VHNQAATFTAAEEPGLTRIKVTVRQRDIVCASEALITVTHELLSQINPATTPARGLPGYTFERAPGESWRSKFDGKRNLIVVNNGHRDFVYASWSKSLKLRYLVRLYAKELVLHNFAGLPADHLWWSFRCAPRSIFDDSVAWVRSAKYRRRCVLSDSFGTENEKPACAGCARMSSVAIRRVERSGVFAIAQPMGERK
jgi:hypothetical protein